MDINKMDINKKVEEFEKDIVKSTQEVVSIKSVGEEGKPGKPYGEGVSKALNKALEISEKLGFKTVNMDGYVGYAEYGGGEEYVGVLGHLDVVPEGDNWKYPPYGAEIHDGKIYGRGTTDDKGPIISALYGLKAIKDLKLPLSKKVRIIFGTNEENGSKEMKYYREREKPPVAGFTPDADYPIIYGEKGITIFDVVKDLKVKLRGDITVKYIKGGQRANVVPDYCEAGLSAEDAKALVKNIDEFSRKNGYDINTEVKNNLVTVKVTGMAAHGSTPELGKNAVMQMFALLGSLSLEKSDIMDFINFFNTYVGFETDGKSFGVALEDKESGRLSFNVGTVSMNEDKIAVALNLRYPVTFKYEDMIVPFNKRLEGTGIRIENMENSDPLFFPSDHPLIKSLQKVYSEQTGKEAELLAIGGGTYAKEIPNIVAFGPIFPGEPSTIHNANEYVEIKNLVLNAKIYAHAIYELAK